MNYCECFSLFLCQLYVVCCGDKIKLGYFFVFGLYRVRSDSNNWRYIYDVDVYFIYIIDLLKFFKFFLEFIFYILMVCFIQLVDFDFVLCWNVRYVYKVL